MAQKLWDYLVFHVNFEPEKTSDKKTDNLELATEKLQGSLSPEYLQKEFPQQFKKKEPQLHPSKQLEVFLKACGNEGWQLKTTERIGGLLMFIFIKEKVLSAESTEDRQVKNTK